MNVNVVAAAGEPLSVAVIVTVLLPIFVEDAVNEAVKVAVLPLVADAVNPVPV